MLGSGVHVICCLLAASLAWAQVGDVRESATLQVELPLEFNATTFEVVLATVGSIPYGASLHGPLIIPQESGCTPFTGTNAVDPGLNAIFVLTAESECNQFQRVLYAARAGATVVLLTAADENPGVFTIGDNSYWQDAVRVPVGMISKSSQNALQSLTQTAGVLQAQDGYAQLSITFPPIASAAKVTVQIWADVDDACGWRCNKVQKFLSELAPVAKAEKDPAMLLVFEPHFLLDPCNGRADCDQHCINNGRYCYFYGIGDGKWFVMETIRRLCLYEQLKAAGMQYEYWAYVSAFQGKECQAGSTDNTCSAAAFDDIEQPGMKDAWLACAAQAGADAPIALADREFVAAEGGSPSNAAPIDRELLSTIRINSVQFRGSPQADLVVEAACQAFTGETKPGSCVTFVQGLCQVTDPGYTACSRDTTHKTRCVTLPGNNYICICDTGWYDIDSQCVDVNECTDDTLCPYTDTRNVCYNSLGGYSCLQYADFCADPSILGCWMDAKQEHSSCVDDFEQFRIAAASLAPGQIGDTANLAKCDCSRASGGGCWEDVGGSGGKQCKECGSSSVGAIVGGLFGFLVLVAAVAGAAFAYLRYRRASHSESLLPNLSWRDSMSYFKFHDKPPQGRSAVPENTMQAAMEPQVALQQC